MAKGSSGNNDKAIKLQQQANKDSAKQNKAILKLMNAQVAAAESNVLPTMETPAAQPTQTSADLEAIAMDRRTRTMRKSASAKTVYAGAK